MIVIVYIIILKRAYFFPGFWKEPGQHSRFEKCWSLHLHLSSLLQLYPALQSKEAENNLSVFHLPDWKLRKRDDACTDYLYKAQPIHPMLKRSHETNLSAGDKKKINNIKLTSISINVLLHMNKRPFV